MSVKIQNAGTLEPAIVEGTMMEVLRRLNEAAAKKEMFALFNGADGNEVFVNLTNITQGRAVSPEDEPFMRSNG